MPFELRQAIRILPMSALLGLSACAVLPSPLTQVELSVRAGDALRRVAVDQEPLLGPVDLYEAIARALKYNLDHRVEMMDAALRASELHLAHYNLLPNVVAGSGYTARDSFNASNSVNVLTGAESLATSTSQEKRIGTADVTFSWNVLDFGLSYVRARQAADKYLIAEELRRKAIHRVVEDVRTAYWRAVSADRMVAKLRKLEGRVRSAQANSKAISDDRQTSPITSVTYERELVEIKRTLLELERDLVVAKTQLSSLMNLKPGTRFDLSDGRRPAPPALKMPVGELISTAMENRVELREVWYRRRINEHELDAALLELLPGLTPYAGSNYDSNDFLFNSNWLSWGAKASWNVIRVFQYPAKRAVIEAQDDLLDERSLAVTMAVLTQVHVSRVRFFHYQRELKAADEYLEVQTRLVNLMRAEAVAGRISEQTLIREEMNTLLAEVRRDIAYASTQNAFANVYASIGLDPYGPDLEFKASVPVLAAGLRRVWVERGDGSPPRRQQASLSRK